MATIEMTGGVLYILDPDNSYETIGDINKVEEFTASEFDNEASYISSLNINTSSSFEAVTKMSKEAIVALFGIRDAVVKCCPNKRVVHLALHAKKPRTRKKNFNRAIRILEKGC